MKTSVSIWSRFLRFFFATLTHAINIDFDFQIFSYDFCSISWRRDLTCLDDYDLSSSRHHCHYFDRYIRWDLSVRHRESQYFHPCKLIYRQELSSDFSWNCLDTLFVPWSFTVDEFLQEFFFDISVSCVVGSQSWLASDYSLTLLSFLVNAGVIGDFHR